LVGAGVLVGTAIYPVTVGAGATAASTSASYRAGPVNCSDSNRFLCAEVSSVERVFGDYYVGHDEPTVAFYSNTAGSGNQMEYAGVLPTEPPANRTPGAASYDFELYPAIWFGMAMCDTQSFPETSNTCTPDSDANISTPGSSHHPGTAYMELQFYPPGYVQQYEGSSCNAIQWCAALAIDSLSMNPVTGQSLNPSCQAVTGVEYANFAFLTKNGAPIGPPNPFHFDPNTSGNPRSSRQTLFLNQGDHYTVTLHDTSNGFQAVVRDLTTGQSGSMTASAANGFAQVKFAPTGTSCTEIPYNFHPMYSTSTPATTVPWAAASYNVAVDTEVGHFDYCSHAIDVVYGGGICAGKEGAGSNKEPADGEDNSCFPAAMGSLYKITGCEGSNTGYDGTSYINDWPDGNNSVTPTPTVFTSPLTGTAYNTNYTKVSFNTDLPNLESVLGTCNQTTGAGCSLIPTSDDGTPAAFYPYYTSGASSGGCAWAPGRVVPGFTTQNYGQNAEYGSLLKVIYPTSGGTTVSVYEDYQGILGNNPCPASASQFTAAG
jgi:hypothetical protein